ncbi:TetR/AcrR family transcriptional regulator [Treponema sp. HNW]|uniref:TetR/AcrR family transcriptional regulator n=1 Tax=Treponema sp. HNW TaxID=3116654 RepID=UPI003D1489A9
MNNVQFKEACINTAATSKEEILEACKAIVSEKGLAALNMRAVAKRCNIALGSVYNYFYSKDALIMAAVESVWHSIFGTASKYKPGISFTEYMEAVFKKIKKGTVKYPDFFTAHSMNFTGNSKEEARKKMYGYFSSVKREMLCILQADTAVKKNLFSKDFSEEDFTDLVLTNFIGLLILQKQSCAVLIAGIRKIIYP